MISVSTMRRVDRWLGLPVSFALTVIRRLIDLFRSKPQGPLRRLLFVKLAEQGSTVLAASAIRRAIELVGREHVYFLVFEDNRFILDVMELIPPENVITIPQRKLLGTVIGALSALLRLRRLRLDAAIDLEFFARSSAALSYLSGARRRVGFHAFGGEGPYRGNLMTHRLRFNPHLHTSQTFRLMVEALTVPPEELPTFGQSPPAADDPPPPLEPRPGEVDDARSLLQDAAGTDRVDSLILLNVNCSDLLPLRRWPDERYIDLARRLTDRYPDVRVGLTGGPSEAPAVAALAEQIGSERCFNLAGHTTLRQLLIIYGLADVLVTNDSGPAHFAALTPIDVVTLFGPENPRLFAARTPRNHVFWEGLACSPCISAFNNRTSPCRNNLCMQQIDVPRVFEQVCRLYDERRTRAASK